MEKLNLLKFDGFLFDLDGTLIDSVDFRENLRTISNTFRLARGKLPYKKDAPELLHTFAAHGKKLGLATNTSSKILRRFFFNNEALNFAAPLKQTFETIVTTDKIKNKKPSPDMFLAALEEMKIEPENAFVFGNTLDDAIAACSAKLKFCIIYDKIADKNRAALKDMTPYHFNSYREILDTIK